MFVQGSKMTEREWYYVEQDNYFLCILEDGQIGWSKHIIDAVDFETEEAATQKCHELGIFFFSVGWRSGPPQAFLYTNPYLQPKEKRIRLHTESHLDYLRRLGLAYP